jgi:flagellin
MAGMVVQHNLSALNANNKLGYNISGLKKATEKLSSGYRINRAGDDAAGLAISEKMRGQIRGLNQAVRNANDGISLIQTAEGALNETHDILQRMRELAVQSANGTYQNEVDRENINKEVEALKTEIDRIASSTHFNNKKLLDGSLQGYASTTTTDASSVNASVKVAGGNLSATETLTFTTTVGADGTPTSISVATGTTLVGEFEVTAYGQGWATLQYVSADDGSTTEKELEAWSGVTITVSLGKDASGKFVSNSGQKVTVGDTTGGVIFQIGANGVEDQQVSLLVSNQDSATLGVKSISVATQDAANEAISAIDKAINSVSATRADLGALQNRLEHTINNLTTTSENLTAAESQIRDTDMAQEMLNFTKYNILQQASQAMLAQANAQPQAILQLLG